MKISSGVVVLEYALYGRRHCAAHPVFAEIFKEVQQAFPEYIVTCAPITQVCVPLKHLPKQLPAASSILIVGEGESDPYVVIKKQLIEVATKDTLNQGFDACLAKLLQVMQHPKPSEHALLLCSLVVTTFERSSPGL